MFYSLQKIIFILHFMIPFEMKWKLFEMKWKFLYIE
jgi:hypothetical protein